MIEIENLSISCNGRSIVSDLTFSVQERTVTSIVGPSGVGKTTVLKSMNRMLEESPEYAVSGYVRFQDRHISDRTVDKYELRRKVGLVFQKPTIFPTSIFKNVIFGIKHIQSLKKPELLALTERCLKDVGLWDEVQDRLFDSALKLSIGQQQRLAIARTLAVGSEVLLMDEPTSSLDVAATERIEALMKDLSKHKTVILVTHDVRQATSISDQIICLLPSRVGAIGTAYCDPSDFCQVESCIRSAESARAHG